MQDRPIPLRLLRSGPSSERSDAELVAALRTDLPWARRELWDRFAPRVRRYLAGALGRPSYDVEDLTQEVFLRLFVRRGAIRNPEALREFVMAVAVRVLKWNLRSRWVRRKIRLSDSGDLPDVISDPIPDEEARDALRRCGKVFDALGTRERVAFTLRFIEEMTMEEVAGTMGVSLSTAKRVTNRAAAIVAEAVARDRDLQRYFLYRGRQGGRDGAENNLERNGKGGS